MSALTKSESYEFTIIGINYQKANVEVRSRFSITEETAKSLYQDAKESGIKSLIVLSTCNRTELYAHTNDADKLISLFLKYSQGSKSEFDQFGYAYYGSEALRYFHRVGCGLESQILGDFEIIGQIKKSAKVAKEHEALSPYLDRIFNSVAQASKKVKNETNLCSGATSVAFAAVQYILNNQKDLENKKILLVGTGKMGRNTCENLVKHTTNKTITVLNRSDDRAELVANKFQVNTKSYNLLHEELATADIVIVATSSDKLIITKDMLGPNDHKLIIDLSVPNNVDPAVTDLDNITLLNVDTLSQITRETLTNRQEEVPKAEEVVSKAVSEFNEWLASRNYAPTLLAFKNKLEDFRNTEIQSVKKKYNGEFDAEKAAIISDKLIQKVTNQLAHHLKVDASNPDESLDLIKQIFQLEKAE
ncbi:MAG: glutamyl-tRNA reductase [bacterium]